jgi:hypothetical protein
MGASGVGKREGVDRDDINLAEEFESVSIGMPKRTGVFGVDRAAVSRSKCALRCCLFAKKIRYLCLAQRGIALSGWNFYRCSPAIGTRGLQGEGAAHGWDHSRQLERRDVESHMYPHCQSHDLSTLAVWAVASLSR